MVRSIDELRAVFDVLLDNRVKFVVVGGIAGAAWGSPSITDDATVVVERSGANAVALARAFPGLEVDAFEARFNFNALLGGTAIAILGLPPGVDDYAELAANAVVMVIAGRDVPVAALEDLIRLKTAGGTAADRVEVEILVALRDARERQGRYDP